MHKADCFPKHARRSRSFSRSLVHCDTKQIYDNNIALVRSKTEIKIILLHNRIPHSIQWLALSNHSMLVTLFIFNSCIRTILETEFKTKFET